MLLLSSGVPELELSLEASVLLPVSGSVPLDVSVPSVSVVGDVVVASVVVSVVVASVVEFVVDAEVVVIELVVVGLVFESPVLVEPAPVSVSSSAGQPGSSATVAAPIPSFRKCLRVISSFISGSPFKDPSRPIRAGQYTARRVASLHARCERTSLGRPSRSGTCRRGKAAHAMEPLRLVSVLGAFVMVGLALAISRNRRQIRWRPVLWGIALQWVAAVILLRVPAGRVVLEHAARGVQTVLDRSYAGSSFVFGQLGLQRGGESGLGVVFAFQVLPTIVFVASLFAVLYHLGIMQLVVRALAWVMMRTMGASGAESLVVAASMFMGQTEAPLTVRPFLSRLTESELFTIMVAGMASVSGAILGAYVTIGGVPIEYLLTAVAMTAPISLVIAKLVVPETGTPVTAGRIDVEIPKTDANVLDAAANGASDGLKLAANVGAMLIAFIALVALLDALLGFIDIGGAPLSLARLVGWAFMPIALLMGTSPSEAVEVGSVLGTRTVLNELVAFQTLHEVGAHISARSQAIATFAICGFANVSSIGILIGGLGGLVPERKSEIARLGVRCLIAATLANFSSACVAGALI
ncbi:MAG TPA: nucleoside transporter C-terminal domain-containing protein [Nannocystaceae bacterium]|nr:nucleoside transporter C-terminal domain-containing protein [Nannocystaceae bacterium]